MDAIVIDKTQSAAVRANAALDAVSLLRQAYQAIQTERLIMFHNFDGGESIDWTHVETIYGLPAGKGVALFTLFDGAIIAIEGTGQNSNAKDAISQVIG